MIDRRLSHEDYARRRREFYNHFRVLAPHACRDSLVSACLADATANDLSWEATLEMMVVVLITDRARMQELLCEMAAKAIGPVNLSLKSADVRELTGLTEPGEEAADPLPNPFDPDAPRTPLSEDVP